MTTDETATPPERRHMDCLVITLSDRAFAGKYADRSGPRVCELLEAFFAERQIASTIGRCLFPDDAAALRREVLGGCQRGLALIVTTGGTGIGPRDIAPDTIAPLCDKLLPGIMEHIRWKCGAANPRARLSRAIAGVIGTTQVYTLPGSVKAVEEYLAEILVTLEHVADTLRGVDTH